MSVRASTFAFVLSLAAAGAALTGCAGASDSRDTTDEDSDEGALTSLQKVTGKYKLTDGAAPGFLSLDLRGDRTFTAEIDRGIRCIVAPCPTNVTLYGTFTAGSKTLTLSQGDGAPDSEFYGRYKMKVQAEGVTLTHSGGGRWDNWKNVLVRETGIWSDDASEIVAHTAGGGFAPPAPPGSECTIGAQDYTFKPESRELEWKVCAWSGNGQPLNWRSGSRTITKGEADAITDAVKGTTDSDRDVCGADKPMLTVSITTPAGTSKYYDSFYSCQGGSKKYVDGIDAIFSAMRDAAH